MTWSAERARGEIWCPGVTALLLGDTMNRILADFRFTVSLQPRRNARPVVIVYCPESRHSEATQAPNRGAATEQPPVGSVLPPAVVPTPVQDVTPAPEPPGAKERHYRIHYGATGFSYETIFRDYLPGAEEITVEDPYIRAHPALRLVLTIPGILKGEIKSSLQGVSMATKKTKHDEPEGELQEPENIGPPPTPAPPAPEPAPRADGEEVKAKLRQERRESRLKEKEH